MLEELLLAHLDALLLRALLVVDAVDAIGIDRGLGRRRAERRIRRRNPPVALVALRRALVVLVDRAGSGDALRHRRVVLRVRVVHGFALVVVGRSRRMVVLRRLLELARARVEADAAHGVRGHELRDVVQLALERAVADLERLLRLALAGGLVQELARLRRVRLREVGHLQLRVPERAVLAGRRRRQYRRGSGGAWGTDLCEVLVVHRLEQHRLYSLSASEPHSHVKKRTSFRECTNAGHHEH